MSVSERTARRDLDETGSSSVSAARGITEQVGGRCAKGGYRLGETPVRGKTPVVMVSLVAAVGPDGDGPGEQVIQSPGRYVDCSGSM
jgi:hypothetical protein